MKHLAVKGQRLDLTMGLHQDGAARSLVDPAALHSNKAVFDQINAADAVFTAEFVQSLHHTARGEFLAVDRDGVAAFELDFNVFSLIRGILGRHGEFEHRLVGRSSGIEPGILEDPGFIGYMQKIAIHRVRLLQRGLNRDFVFGAVGDHLGATGEQVTVFLHFPRSDDLEIRSERHVGELKTALVVTLSGRAMRHRIGLFLAGYVDLGLGDQWTGDGRAEEILAFINRVGPDHRENVVACEFLDEI